MIDLTDLPGCLYLRKSRKDIVAEREALAMGKPYDTLARHMDILVGMVKHYKVNVVDTFTEVVSGEFIAERIEFQKVLEGLTDGKYRWVGVVDEDRLGRGDKIDQGRIERAFKEAEAYILTPHKIVNLADEADEQYMDYKGMGARYEYKQTKKRLQGGRRKSASEGKYIGRIPPYGYLRGIDLKTNHPELIGLYAEKAADIDNLKLYPHPEQVKVVQQIFRLVADGVGIRTIGRMLTGVYENPSGKRTWERSTIINIINNRVYLGEIVWGKNKYTKQEDGTYRIRKARENEIVIVKNAHEAIITEELFQAAHERRLGAPAPINRGKIMTNVFAGILRCYYCEHNMHYAPYYAQPNKKPRLSCNNPYCKRNASIIFEAVESDVLEQIKKYYEELTLVPLKREGKKNAALEMKKRRLEKLDKDLEEIENQINQQYDLLEQKTYTIEIFMKRQEVTLNKKEKLITERELLTKELEVDLKEEKNKKQIAPLVKNVLANYKLATTVKDKNDLLKSIIDSIYYKKEPSEKKRGRGEYTIEIIWLD